MSMSTTSAPSPSSRQPQLTLFVTFHVHPSLIPAWKAAHRPVWAAVAAEPRSLLFDVFEDPAAPGVFRLVEVWAATRAWFEAEQLAKPYYTALWERSRPTWVREPVLEYYERLGEGFSHKPEYLEG